MACTAAPKESEVMAFKEPVLPGPSRPAICISATTGAIEIRRAAAALRMHLLRRRPVRDYCVADLVELAQHPRGVTAAFIACGIDPRRQIVFNQSQVAEHAELLGVQLRGASAGSTA
jgi:hypothetical protein